MPHPRKVLIAALVALLQTPFFASALETQPIPGTWTNAVALGALPDGSLLVAQRSGRVEQLISEGTDYRPAKPWVDLGDNGNAELLGFAVDPDYLSTGYVYAATRSVSNGHPVVQVTRWRATETGVVLNRILVDNLPSGWDRAGGVVKVGPDGYLWVGIGDGAAPASDVVAANLRGVLLRYNKDGSIPADNPSPNSPVWAYGFRDPSGLAWQPDSGRLYALDRGPAIPRGTMDRLDLIEKSANYGWPKYIGRDYATGVSRPVIYCSSGHSWVPGGAVFVPSGEWKGSLLFAGAGEGNLYRLSLDAKAPTKILFYEELVGGQLGPLVDVAIGSDDKPYLLSRDKLYRLVP